MAPVTIKHSHRRRRLVAGARNVVDLCAAPGSWSQVLARRLILPYKDTEPEKAAKVVAVDLQPMAPIEGVITIQVCRGCCCVSLSWMWCRVLVAIAWQPAVPVGCCNAELSHMLVQRMLYMRTRQLWRGATSS